VQDTDQRKNVVVYFQKVKPIAIQAIKTEDYQGGQQDKTCKITKLPDRKALMRLGLA
jgi:hypothetical protein